MKLKPDQLNYKKLWPQIGLLLITLAVFHRVLFFKESFFVGDILVQYYPVRFFIQKWLNQGVFPIWCDQIFNGFPLLASSQSGIFNPLERIVFFLFEPLFAYNLNIAAHFLLCAVSMYTLAKELFRDSQAAFLVSISFTFSGFFLISLTYMTIFSICYLPLAFLLANRCFTSKRADYTAALAVVLAIQLFAGGAQYTFYTLIALAVLAGFRIVKPAKKGVSRISHVWFFALALTGFLLLAAAQILPTFELIAQSIRRSGVERDIWEKASFPLRHFITMIIPHYWGEIYRFGIYRGEWNFIDLNCYLGIAPLVLASLPLFAKKRSQVSNYLFIMMGITVFLALGKFNPLYQFLYYLPVFKSFRYPGRIMVLWVFSVALNAGFGYSLLSRPEEKKRLRKGLYFMTGLWLVLAVTIFLHLNSTNPELYNIRLIGWYKMNCFFLLSLAPLYWLSHKGMNRVLLFSWFLLLILVDNLSFGYPFNPTVKKSLMKYQPPIWQKMIDANAGQGRIFSKKTLPFYLIQRAKLLAKNDMSMLIKTNYELLQGNLVLLTPFSVFNGYDQLEDYRNFFVAQKLGLNRLTGRERGNPFLGRSGVTGLLRWKKQPLKKQKPLAQGEYAYLYQQTMPHPRAYLATGYQVLGNPSFALKFLNSSSFNPKRTVFLDEEPDLIQTNDQPGSGSAANKIEIKNLNPNHLIIRVKTNQAGWLVLNDSYYPGWTARVDGTETKIYRANLLFRAVRITQGTHKVEFKYQPKSWLLGGTISLLTLALLTTVIVLSAIKRRSRC